MTDTLNWTHVDFSGADGVEWIRTKSGLDTLIADALLVEDSRPRTLLISGGALIILRGVNLNPGSAMEDMVSIRVWMTPDRVISTSRRALRSISEIRDAVDSGAGPSSPGEFLSQLVMRLGDYIGDAIEQIEERLEQAEELISETRSIALSSPFSALRRRSARIRRYLGPQREALDRLLSCPDELLTPDNKADLHEQVNRLTLILEDLDLVRERAMVAQEEFLGIVAHEQNSRMLVLSIVAAIFLPLSFLTGLMGMNVAGLPGTENENAFLITLALMLVASAGIILLFRFKRWF